MHTVFSSVSKTKSHVLQLVLKYKTNVLALIQVPIADLRYSYSYPLITNLQVLVKYPNIFKVLRPTSGLSASTHARINILCHSSLNLLQWIEG